MKFLEIIVENSTEKIAKLYRPAFKAYENPENGINILNKSAYHVIKDCAGIAKDYIPLLVFGLYKNPFDELRGKFKRKDIEEFLNNSSSINNKQLLIIIKNKISDNFTPETKKEEIFETYNTNDPYGDYGISNTTQTKKISYANDLDLLCSAFGVNI
jgi:hypothetical protein